MPDYQNEYGYQYHTYPIHSQDITKEGSFKRFTPMPGPKEVFDYALLGLPKFLPLTSEAITQDFARPFLESAITEIEMNLGCNLSEVGHQQSEDYIDGSFSNNFMGIQLRKWPATKVNQIILKYPHTNTQETYQSYTIPPAWIYLHKNKVNIVAAIGSVTVSTSSPSVANAGGIFQYITGFGRGAYQPGTIEVNYDAGFKSDQLPSSVADLIKTWAAQRMLSDLAPVLFPNSSVNVSVDGVSQGVTYNVQQLIQTRLEQLEKKKNDLKRSFVKAFSRTVKTSYIGA